MRVSFAAMAVLVTGTALSTSAASQELTLWSHWADHDTKVAFVEEAVKRFEEKNPGATVKITWYQKNPLYAALKGALQSRKSVSLREAFDGPDLAAFDLTEIADTGAAILCGIRVQ